MPIYVNIDTPNLGFPYFNFLWGYQLKNDPVIAIIIMISMITNDNASSS